MKLGFKILFSLICMLANVPMMAQRDNVWTFGARGGLDFSTATPTPLFTSIDGYGEAAASISDYRGRLMFYTNGTDVWDSTHVFMPNGLNLIGLSSTSGVTTASTSQGTLIIPFPDSVYLYYVFSLTAYESSNPGRLSYSVIDMRLNNGKGDVVPGKKGILLDTGLTEKMTAVSTPYCKIWVLVRSDTGNTFKAFGVTATGVDINPVVSVSGKRTSESVAGYMSVSPDGTKLANCSLKFYTNSGGWLELHDFNRFTGRISNGRMLDSGDCYYGAAFSPNSSVLYTTSYCSFFDNYLFQYDLSVPSPVSFVVGKVPFTGLKLGPDKKIYFKGNTPLADSRSIGVIAAPNNLGAACLANLDYIRLPLGSRIISGISTNIPLVIPDTSKTSNSINGCFSGVTLSAPAGCWAYTWNDGTFGAYKRIGGSGTYWVTYIGPTSCQFHIDTYKVWVPPIPEVGTVIGCKDMENSIAWIRPGAGDTNIYQYSWYNSSDHILRTASGNGDTLKNVDDGSYIVHVTIPGICDTLMPVDIIIPNYAASFTVDTTVCEHEVVQFRNMSEGLKNYAWNFGDGATSADTDPSYVYANAGTYHVRLMGNTDYPCYDSAVINVYVQPRSFGTFVKDRDSICAGHAITFYPQYTGSIDSIRWDFGAGLGAFDNAKKIFTYDRAGSYIVSLTVSSPYCPDTSFSDTVTVFPYPIANIGPDTTLCPNSNPVMLQNLASEPGSIYLWNTGETEAAITVNTPGIYWLKVTNGLGCYTADSVEIKRHCYLDIPNAFSPNGDGVNDYFFPKENITAGIARFTMKIFNRWGQQIFETINVAGRGWDGNFNGVEQEQGVYIYLIEATLENGTTERYQGNVTLIK